MPDITIYLANKNYSSWSLRGWLALKQTGEPFDEIVVPMKRPDTRETMLRYSPTGLMPALKHGDILVWESLAICEYLAETFPAAGLWPADRAARAHARSVAAEMHAGFRALRQELPMNVRGASAKRDLAPEVRDNINRITAIWRDCIDEYGGPCLFGGVTAADAMFAPVVSRFTTYKVEIDETSESYRKHIWDLPAMKEWRAAAKDEPMVIEDYEL